MQKLDQLFFDSVEGSCLPFFPAGIESRIESDWHRSRERIRPVLTQILNQTRLPLLGFFMIVGRQLPAPVCMLTEYKGKFYQIAPTGDTHALYTRPLKHKNDIPDRIWPDIDGPAGASVCVGHTAYAVSQDHIIFGPHWQVRKELRQLLKASGTPYAQAFAIRQHLEELAPQLLLARVYAKGRNYAKASQAVQEQVALHKKNQQKRQAAFSRPAKKFQLVVISGRGGHSAEPASPAAKPEPRRKAGGTQRLSAAIGP